MCRDEGEASQPDLVPGESVVAALLSLPLISSWHHSMVHVQSVL